MRIVHTGVILNSSKATPGYVLVSPAASEQVYLVDYTGTPVHSWAVGRGLTHWSYLLPNGHLFVNERCDEPKGVALTGSGLMREYDWQGNLVWEHLDPWQHHDARRLSNGNAVYLAYTPLAASEQTAIKGGIAGSESESGIQGECIREVNANGDVVFEWNFSEFGPEQFPLHPNANRWSRGHTNTIVPLTGDRYLISCKTLNLIFVLCRKTGTVLWHYQDDKMSGQHDVQMLENGNILLFANGAYAADLHHSQVWELNPDTREIVWRYIARDNPQSFFSPHIGGCQRLESGNTLICEGAKGCLFEVTPEGEVAWEYVSPYANEVDQFGKVNWLFRARHYLPGAPELQHLR
ncbi:MAG: arylsulfotransferase family protein [Granulosicoccus sp.]|nr:arylsulfotransferase family protein [Granulosicoccus sp.]